MSREEKALRRNYGQNYETYSYVKPSKDAAKNRTCSAFSKYVPQLASVHYSRNDPYRDGFGTLE